MKKKIIIAAIIGVITIGTIIGSIIYSSNHYRELHLVCKYHNEDHKYDEVMDFYYVKNTLYEFKRNEVTETTTKKNKKTLLDFYQNREKTLDEYTSEYFGYEVEEDGMNIKVNTYMKVLYVSNVFDKYLKDKGINSKSSIDEVKKALDKDYNCKIVKKK